jgi:hypothetical protein
MKRLTLLSKIILGLFVISLFSCTSTQIISSWASPNPPAAQVMNKILVVCVMQDRAKRDKMEQTMADELNRSSVTAATAVSIFGPKGFRGLSEEEVNQKLKNSGYSSVMIISLLDRNRQVQYNPGYSYVAPYTAYNLYYRRYMFAYDYMYVPGYYSTSTRYVLQAELYTIDGDELVYSAQTKTYDPNDTEDLGQSFAKAIVSELREKMLLPTSTKK